VKTLNKCSRSSHLWRVIMHFWVSGVAEVLGITHMWWLHHKWELGGNSSTLHYWVGWFPRKLPVNFRHQTSYLSHVFRAVRIKSQFDIYFTQIKQLNKISYTCSKLNEEFRIFRSVGNCSFHIHKAQLVKCWEFFIEFSSRHFVSAPSPNPNW